MSIQDPFAFLKKQTESHLGLAGQLARVNIDGLEKMVLTQLSSSKELVVHFPRLSLAAPGNNDTFWEAVCCSSIEYWKKCTLDGLAYQHRVLQVLTKRSVE